MQNLSPFLRLEGRAMSKVASSFINPRVGQNTALHALHALPIMLKSPVVGLF